MAKKPAKKKAPAPKKKEQVEKPKSRHRVVDLTSNGIGGLGPRSTPGVSAV